MATAGAAPAGMDAELDRQIGTLLQEATGATATAGAEGAASGNASADDEARLIKQLDQMLASAAEEAISADVQGVELPAPAGKAAAVEVAEAPPALAPAKEAPAPASAVEVSAAPTAVGAVAVKAAETKGEPGADARAVTPVKATETTPPTETEPAGSVKAAGATGFAATASDVARELQEDKKGPDVAAMAATPETSSKVSQAGAGTEAAPPARSLAGQLLWGLCATISRPVAGLSPQVRTVLGYVALATLLNGLLLTAWGLVKVLG